MNIEKVTQAALAATVLILATAGIIQRGKISRLEETIAQLQALGPDTIFWNDTDPEPAAKDSVIVQWKTRWLPAAHDTTYLPGEADTIRDTVRVYIPITQKHYAADNYDAWVSGYEPKLDSLHIHMPNTLPPTIIQQRRRNGLAITIGPQVGITTGKQPYLGIGITAGFSFGISKK